jgi:hypothetical protein
MLHIKYLQYKSDDYGNALTAKVVWNVSQHGEPEAPNGRPIGRLSPPTSLLFNLELDI